MKNNVLRIIFLFLSLISTAVSQAQGLRHRTLKLDVVAPSRKGLQLAYEMGLKSQNSFELQVMFERHSPPAGVEVFHGDWLRNYAEEKIDTINTLTNQLMASSGWRYWGIDRALPEVPTYVAHSTVQAAGVFRIPLLHSESKWGIFLQTGFFVTLHRYYENREKLVVVERLEDESEISSYFGIARYQRHSLYRYQEQRSIRLKNHLRAGVAYQVGVTRKLGRHLLLEGRLDAGMHIGPQPYEKPDAPIVAQRMPWKPVLMIGWRF